jgi:hypothetical protein
MSDHHSANAEITNRAIIETEIQFTTSELKKNFQKLHLKIKKNHPDLENIHNKLNVTISLSQIITIKYTTNMSTTHINKKLKTQNSQKNLKIRS